MDYFEYIPNSSPEWWKKTPPERDLSFEKELTSFGGTNPFGEPILRVGWGGTLRTDTFADNRLKYAQTWRGITHYVYTDEGGGEVKVLREDAAPKGRIVRAVEGQIELGRLRWIIEAWMDVDTAVATGRFRQDVVDDNGRPLLRKPDPKGIYNAFFWIQTLDGGYRALDNGVLEKVKAMWRYHLNNTPEQKAADLMNDLRRERKQSAEDAANAWNRPADRADIEAQYAEARQRAEAITEMMRRSNSVTI